MSTEAGHIEAGHIEAGHIEAGHIEAGHIEAGHEVTVRELRNHGGRVLDRVVRGEVLTVTKDGTGVAELRPLRRRSLPAAELIARARRAPAVDPERLRRDIDAVLDQSL